MGTVRLAIFEALRLTSPDEMFWQNATPGWKRSGPITFGEVLRKVMIFLSFEQENRHQMRLWAGERWKVLRRRSKVRTFDVKFR